MPSKSGLFSKLFNKPKDSSSNNLPPGKDIPVPVKQIIELEVVFEVKTFDKDEEKWLRELAIQIVKQCWPTFLDTLVKSGNPNASFTTRFTDSEQVAKSSVEKANKLHANLITQPNAAILSHPSKGPIKYQFTLNLYLNSDLSRPANTVVMAPNHRVIAKP